MDRLLWYLFAGSRGGPTRIQIMRALLDEPQNAHQLAKTVGRDYKTIEYQLRVLTKHVVVVCDDPKAYGALYHPSKNFMAAEETFERITQKVEKKAKAKAKANAGVAAPREPAAENAPRADQADEAAAAERDPAIGET